MQVQSHSIGEVVVMNLEGRFDAYSAPQVNERLEEALRIETPRLVVNMEKVSFVDSTALATLVQAMKRCRQMNGDLRISNLKQPVQMIFELTRLDRAFEIFPSAAEAVEAFNQ